MKKIILNITFILLPVFLFSCVTGPDTTTNRTRSQTLGNASAAAPLQFPPLHVKCDTNSKSLVISPYLVFNTTGSSKFTTDNRGNPVNYMTQGDTISISERNLQWEQSLVIGADMEVFVNRWFSFFGGLNYSSNDYADLFSSNFGFGATAYSGNFMFRFDMGLRYHEFYHDYFQLTHEIVDVYRNGELIETNTRDFYEIKRGKDFNFNPFVSVTVNTVNIEDKLNYFISGGYFDQSFFRIKHNANPMVRASVIYLAPGISYRFHPNFNVVMDLKCAYVTGMESSENILIYPALKVDFLLNAGDVFPGM